MTLARGCIAGGDGNDDPRGGTGSCSRTLASVSRNGDER
jgi:hypothetical protein